MFRFKLSIVLFTLFLTAPVHAQGPITFYFPIIVKDTCMPTCEDHWKIVAPVGTTNYVLNPSAEATDRFAAAGGAVISRSTTFQKYGLYSYQVTTSANGEGLSLNLVSSGLTNVDHYVTLRVRGVLPPNWVLGIGTNYSTPLLLESIDNNWSLYGAFIPASEANSHTALHILQYGTGSGVFYVDGVQVEPHAYPTTYCDGTQEGCDWLGLEHAGISERSARSRAGGRVRDLYQDYGFVVESFSGAGTPPVRLTANDYALLPGGELNSAKTEQRRFVLTGTIFAENEKDLYAKRQALALVLDPSAYDRQPVRIRFTGSDVQKEISAIYEGGLEADLSAFLGISQRDTLSGEWNEAQVFTEKVAIRFLAPNPYWYEVGESAAELDPHDSATFRYIAGRLRSTGQWSALGLTVDPTANGRINSIVIGPDKQIYVGGLFTDWNGLTGVNNIAVYDPVAGTWSGVGNAGDFTGEVTILAFDADGSLYAGGVFTDCASKADADYIAQWDGTAWYPVGQPVQGTAAISAVAWLAFDRVGNLFIGGNFTNWANITNADYIVRWDGSSYSAVGGGGGTGLVQAIVLDSQDNIYIGGSFSNWAGDGNADNLAWWNGTTWAAVNSTSLNDVVYTLVMTPEDVLYVGGEFTNAAGIANADRIVGYNGTSFFALGTGLNGSCVQLQYLNGNLYAGGAFTTAGGINLADRVARWNGASWTHLDVDLPVTPNPVLALAAVNPDPVISSNFDLFVSPNTSGAGSLAGLATATNDGTAPAFPLLVFSRVEGGTAVIESVRNETTGKELLFNYSLLGGEELSVNLAPTAKSIESSYFGSRPDAILANSDFGSFALEPGDNSVSCFVNYAAALYATEVVPYLLWRDPYRSID